MVGLADQEPRLVNWKDFQRVSYRKKKNYLSTNLMTCYEFR